MSCNECDSIATMQNDDGRKLCFTHYCELIEDWYEIEETEQ